MARYRLVLAKTHVKLIETKLILHELCAAVVVVLGWWYMECGGAKAKYLIVNANAEPTCCDRFSRASCEFRCRRRRADQRRSSS